MLLREIMWHLCAFDVCCLHFVPYWFSSCTVRPWRDSLFYKLNYSNASNNENLSVLTYQYIVTGTSQKRSYKEENLSLDWTTQHPKQDKIVLPDKPNFNLRTIGPFFYTSCNHYAQKIPHAMFKASQLDHQSK